MTATLIASSTHIFGISRNFFLVLSPSFLSLFSLFFCLTLLLFSPSLLSFFVPSNLFISLTLSLSLFPTHSLSHSLRGHLQATGYIIRFFGGILGALLGAIVYNKVCPSSVEMKYFYDNPWKSVHGKGRKLKGREGEGRGRKGK